MRVLVLVLASRDGGAYDAMRRAWGRHAASAPPGFRVRWIYGAGAADVDGPPAGVGDLVFDVPESIIPGALDKTVRALAAEPRDYDFLVRTNLSSFLDWRGLAGFLSDSPRARFAAGYSPDRTHLSGCQFIASADVAARLAAAPLDRSLVDDLAWSAWLGTQDDVRLEWTPRIDLVSAPGGEAGLELHPDPRTAAAHAWHARLKHLDRDLDARLLSALVSSSAPGEDSARLPLLSRCELAWATASGQINFAGATNVVQAGSDRFGGVGRV